MKEFGLKLLNFVKQNWKWLLIIPILLYIIGTDKIKKWWNSLLGKDEYGAEDNDSSEYQSDRVPADRKGEFVIGGMIYFYYGNKRIPLNDAVTARVVQYVDQFYQYASANTNDIVQWILDDSYHFYANEIQALLNNYVVWCKKQETYYHYFAYVFKQLHDVPMLTYLKSCTDAEGYEAMNLIVPQLGYFYY